jgi:hypothetical protein
VIVVPMSISLSSTVPSLISRTAPPEEHTSAPPSGLNQGYGWACSAWVR